MEQFASRFIRHLKFEASILRQTKREQSEFLPNEVSNADKFRQLMLTGGILNLSSSVDSRIPNLRNAIRTARKRPEGVGDMFSFSLTSSGNAGYVRLAPERNLQIRDVVLIMGENTPGRTGRWGV